MVNCSGGLRSTASPSTPACTGAAAPTSRRGALHARPGGWGGPARCVENDDPEPAAVKRRTGTGSAGDPACRGCSTRARGQDARARAPRRQPAAALAPLRLDRAPSWRSPGVCAPWHLDRRTADRFAVDPERDVVDKQPAVHFYHVDQALDSVGERVERAEHILRIQPQIEREVVAGPSRDADKRKPMRGCCRGHDRQRPVAPGHAQRVGTIGHGSPGQCFQALARPKDDGLNPPFACPLGNLSACGLAPARSRVDKQHRPSRWIRGPPARTRHSDTIHYILARRR